MRCLYQGLRRNPFLGHFTISLLLQVAQPWAGCRKGDAESFESTGDKFPLPCPGLGPAGGAEQVLSCPEHQVLLPLPQSLLQVLEGLTALFPTTSGFGACPAVLLPCLLLFNKKGNTCVESPARLGFRPSVILLSFPSQRKCLLCLPAWHLPAGHRALCVVSAARHGWFCPKPPLSSSLCFPKVDFSRHSHSGCLCAAVALCTLLVQSAPHCPSWRGGLRQGITEPWN